MVSKVETNPAGEIDIPALHALLNAAFAPMAGRIDPPSSLTTMSADDVACKTRDEDFFAIRENGAIVACLFGHPEADAYEVGKLAVAPAYQGKGLARRLVDAAAAHARTLGHRTLQLYARVELTENHAIYGRLGFTPSAYFTHPGFDRPTAVIFRRPL